MPRIATISDTHGGHRFGLLYPGVRLTTLQAIDDEEYSDEWSPELTEANKYLVNIHERLVEEASATQDEIDLIHVGEPFWGAKHPSGAIDLSERVQIDIALGNLRRWYELPNLRRAEFVSGTDAHEYEENSALKTLVKELRLIYPHTQTRATHHALIDIDGYQIDVTHHGPHPGSRSWLAGNMARFYLRDHVMRSLIRGNLPANLYLRGHYHTRVSETLEVDGEEYRLIVMPSFIFMNGHARRATQGEYELTNGGMWFDVNGGVASRVHWVTQTLDLRERRNWSYQ